MFVGVILVWLLAFDGRLLVDDDHASILCGCLVLMIVHPHSFTDIPHTLLLIHKQHRLSLSFTNNTYSSSHSLTAQTLLLIH